jgi:glycosyltransferase involved in cell wall biosynthesis
LHAHFGTNTATVACMTSSLSGIPYSFTVHGPEEFDRAPGLGLAHKIARAGFVVAISEFGRGQLMRWCASEHWPKIKVVRCGLDERFLKSSSVPVPDNARVVCVGRLVEQKAQLVLVEAAAILKARGIAIEVRLIGGGEMQPQIEAAVARYGLHEKVKLLGWLSAADVHREMNEARVIAQPSLAEGLPVALMEALALCRPVVTTRIAGIPELIDREVGWVVSPGSAEELAAALSDALAAPTTILDGMGRVGRERVVARHDITIEAGRLRTLFGEGQKVG